MKRGPVLPGATVGVVGGGQLGRMLALEARRMGYRTLVLDPAEDAPAAQVCDGHLRAPLDDADAIRELARRSDVVTLEWENADVEALRSLPGDVRLHPGPHVLEAAQHRVREKDAARRLGLPTADYRAVGTPEELRAALAEVGTPAVLKTARWGYDGKGQAVIGSPGEAAAAFAALGGPGTELVLEAWVPFELELSVVCARTAAGEVASFPAGENAHVGGILDTTTVPARVPDAVAREARRIAEAMAEGLDVVGVLGVEMFLEGDGTLRVNEVAPRPHNSGHYTWEACPVSQFEQQLRAVCGLPLGSTELLRPAAMANLLGEHVGNGLGRPETAALLSYPAVALHLYGKAEGRPGRKMGHLTVLADTPDEALERALRARRRFTGGTRE
ncbi:MAG TPA: 5-(carboxyamino)imidazole ribonucleotide synthase [Longimicrobiaceae bacterium]|nr:5-(carboxyamino)imidazole ribonucleotide synthase [Longimicrobiaceae bacterium]